jgi:predicted dehydrogenase
MCFNIPEMKKISWGIIGCGDVTEVKSGPAFQLIENSELVAVMRRDGEKARDYALRHRVREWFTSADELINNPRVNAIYVATPPGSHARYAIQAMRAGKPVYVEKPMALNEAECLEMNRVSRETGQPLFVAYYRRKLPMFLKLKEIVDSKRIGDIRFVNIQLHFPARPEEADPNAAAGWRVFPEISGGGHFHDMASHQLDYLGFLLGPVAEAHGIAINQAGLYPAEDMVTAALKFESGIAATGSWCFTVPELFSLDRTEITGSEGRIAFSFFKDTKIVITTIDGKSETIDLPHPPHIQQPLIQSVVDELRGEDVCPSTGETAIRTTVLLNRITNRG